METKHEIANKCVSAAIDALVAAITEDILGHPKPRGYEIVVTCYPTDRMGFHDEKEFKFLVDDDDNITICEGEDDEEFTLSDIEIGDLIDISNAILCGNIV